MCAEIFLCQTSIENEYTMAAAPTNFDAENADNYEEVRIQVVYCVLEELIVDRSRSNLQLKLFNK